MDYTVVRNFLQESECSQLIQMCEAESDEIELWHDDVSDHTVKRVWIKNDLNTRMRFSLSEFPVLAEALQQHNYTVNTAPEDTFYIAKYEPGQFIRSHRDPESLTQSVIVNLNSDYHGGNLLIGSVVPVNCSVGDAIVFDPQTQHAVTKVYAGTRYSLIFWLSEL